MTPAQEKWILKYLLARLTQMWQWHPPRKQCKQHAYLGRGASGEHRWQCAICIQSVDAVQVDHKIPKGAAPTKLSELEAYIRVYFCGLDNLQAVCVSCHKSKTKKDVKQIRAMKKVTQ